MTLDLQTSRVVFKGNGVAVEFPFDFKVWDASQIAVFVSDDPDSINEMEVTPQKVILTESGGTVTYTLEGKPLPEGYTLSIVRNMPFIQEDMYITGTRFNPEVIETRFDKDCAERQQILEMLSRCIKVSVTSDMTPEQLLKAIFKAYHDILESLASTGSITGAIPVVATGTTEPRPLKDRFADIINVKDFGAKGDGVTDDTEAFKKAVSASNGRAIWLAGGIYNVSEWPDSLITGGKIFFEGKLSNADGAFSSIRQRGYIQKKLCETKVHETSGDPIFTNAEAAPQGVAYLNVNGVDKLFVSIRVFGASLAYAYNMCRIVEYNLVEDGTAVDPVQFTEPLSIGHGQGLGAQYIDGDIYLYAQETGVPERYLSSGKNFGKGFTRIHYKGASTTNSDCVSYRLFPFYKEDNTSFEKNTNFSVFTPTITPDGKRIVLMQNGQIFVYRLSDILNIQTPDVDYTWDDAATGENKPFDEEAVGYTPIATRIDATDVQPITNWPVDANTTRSRQGIACDNQFIYLSSGSAALALAKAVEVYDYTGHRHSIMWMDGWTSQYSRQQILGDDPILQQFVQNENEGIFVKDNALCTIQYHMWKEFGDIVEYNGRNYACVTSNTGMIPDNFADYYWQPCLNPATRGAWNASTAYIGARDRSKLITKVQTGIFALVPSEAINEDPERVNIPIIGNNCIQGHYNLYLPKGYNFSINGFNPFTGETYQKAVIGDRNLNLFDSSGASSYLNLYYRFNDNSRNYARFTVVDKNGQPASVLRGYSNDDTVAPGNLQMEIPGGTTLLSMSKKGLKLRAGSSITNLPLTVFNTDAQELLRTWASGTGVYFSGINKNIIFRRDTTSNYENFVAGEGVGLFSTTFKALNDNALNLGESAFRFSQVYAASGSIDTSDAREKQSVEAYPDAVLDAWGEVSFRQFLFKDAVLKKGDAARIHSGIVAQQVMEVFTAHNLDATRYGLLCHDEWQDEYEDITVVDSEAVLDADGNEVMPAQTHTEKRLITAAGDRYGIRYSEALCLEAAYQRRRADRIEARLAALEKKLGSV